MYIIFDMVGVNFQIFNSDYWKMHLWNFSTFLGTMWSSVSHAEQPPQKFVPISLSCHEKAFFGKTFPNALGRTPCFPQGNNSAVWAEFAMAWNFHFPQFIDKFLHVEVYNGISHPLCLKCEHLYFISFVFLFSSLNSKLVFLNVELWL